MEEYINDAGDLYTIEEINQAAEENKTTFEDIIKKNKLSPNKKKETVTEEVKVEEPGKQKPVVKKDAVATAKSTASKSVKPSSVSPDNPFGKTKTFDPLGLDKFNNTPAQKPKKQVEFNPKKFAEEISSQAGEGFYAKGEKNIQRSGIKQKELETKTIDDVFNNFDNLNYSKLSDQQKLELDNSAIKILNANNKPGAQYKFTPNEVQLKAQEILTKASDKKKSIEGASYLDRVVSGIAAGANYVGESFASIPETVYRVFALPQNAVAAITGNKDLEVSPEKLKKQTGTTNPVMDYFVDEQKKIQKANNIFDNANYDSKSITENLKNGNYSDAFKLLGTGLAESAPISIGMMAGGANMSIGKLAAASTLAMAGPEVRQQKEANPELSEIENVMNGFGMAGAESVFSAIGEGSIGKVYKDIIKKEGLDTGSKIFKDGLISTYQTALKKYGVPTAMLGEGLEEVATTITQNLISKKPAFENTMDSFIAGVGGGAVWGSPITLQKSIEGFKDGLTVHKINTELKTGNASNLKEVFNPNTPITETQIKIASIPNSYKILTSQIDNDVAADNMTIEEGDKIKMEFAATYHAASQLKPLDLPSTVSVEVSNLLKDRDQLNRVIKNVNDPTLTTFQSDKVKEINSRISELTSSVAKEKIEKSIVADVEKTKAAAKAIGFSEEIDMPELNTANDVITYLSENTELDENTIEDLADSYGAFIPLANGKEALIINKEAAGMDQVVTTGQHEFLHKLVYKAVKDNPELQKKIGTDLYNHIENYIGTEEFNNTEFKNRYDTYKTDFENTKLELENKIAKAKSYFENGTITQDRYNQAISDAESSIFKAEGKYLEETLPLLSESLTKGDVKYNETFFTKIGDILRRIFQKYGLSKVKFNTGKDVFDFVRDYNKSFEKGQFTKAFKALAKEGTYKGSIAKGNAPVRTAIKTEIKKSQALSQVETLKNQLKEIQDNEFDYDPDDFDQQVANLQSKIKKAIGKEKTTPVVEVKKEVSEEDDVKEIIKSERSSLSSDRVQQIYIEKGLNGADEIIKLFRPITNKIVDKRRDAPGFDRELLTDEIETGVGGILDLIKKYNPESGIPLAAYINKYLPVRAIATSRRILDQQFKKDVTEEKGLMAEETVIETKEKPKYKNALESKVFPLEVLKTATNKIITIVRTLKSRIDAPVTLNRTITPIISEIRDEIGKQLDIDIKTMLGGKKDGVLRKELLRTKRYILENMTTTWLMGKDGQGGIPQAIQKQIDGKWVNFPDWVGKKIDREKTTTDQAGRTSGAELVRRLPNVANNISDEVFLAQIIGPDGNPIRGRKESLSKAMSEEGAFDIINADIAEEGPIFEALATNQERLGYEMANNFAATFSKQSERGNVKFSKALKQAQDVLEKLPNNVKSTLVGIDGNTLTNFIKDVKDEEDLEKLFNLVYEDTSFEPEDRNKIVNAIKSIYSFYKKQSGKSTAKTYGIKLNEDFESFANRKIFNTLSKDQSLALTVNIPSSDLKWESKTDKKAAQVHMKNFYKSAIKNFTANKSMSKAEAQKLFTRLFSRSFSYGKDQSLFDNQQGFFNAFLKGQPGFTIGAGEIRGWTILYNGTKVNSSIGEYGQATSAKDIAEFIRTGNPNEINIEERKAISTAAKKDLKILITALKEMYTKEQINNTQLGLIFKSLGGSMNSPLKLASELRYVAEKGNYSSNTKEWVYEHVPPSSYISRIALGIITGKTDTSIDEFMDKLISNSYVTILPKSFDKSVNELYKSNMPFYYEIGDNPLIRYLDAGFNGKEVPAFYDLYDKKQINNAVIKDAFSSKIIKDTQEAVLKSYNLSRAPKGISVFDFDDTVGLTKSNVLYTMPDGTKGKLNGAEFAKEGSRLLDEGAQFDFSEFSKVVEGKPGPMVEKMKKMIAKFGPDNFFILTARPADSAGPIHQFLSSIGIDIPLENITGLGNSTAQAKADWMTAKAAEGYNDFYFADDAIQNVEAVKKALDIPGVDSKVQRAMIKFSLTSKQDLKWNYYDDSSFADFKVKGKSYKIELADVAHIDYPELLAPTIDKLIEKYNLNKDDILQERGGKTYQLVFEGEKGDTGITGVGNAAETFGVVINGVIEYAKENNTETFVFAAKEPSRRKLYNAMANVIANKMGWNAFYENGVYIISKKGPVTEGAAFNNQNNKVNDVLNVIDIKSPIQQSRIKFSKTISPEFNKIIEENTGMENYKVFSDIVARRRGADKNKFDFYVPPSAADFELLLYNFIGKGKRGEEQQKFFADALLKPYANGNDLMDAARQSIKKDYKALTDQFPDIKNKIEKLTPDGDFTYDQAIRVAMWTEEGVEIPGISQRDQRKLTDLVNNDPELAAFKQGLIITGRQGKGWVAPTEFWDASTIISDLHNLTEGEGRKKFLAEFIDNAQEMFGKWENGKLVGPNINKVEAVYGTNVREAIEDVLYRMTTGKNRSQGKDKETSMWANWVTGSTGAIMFLNVRSAALQLIGATNFLNLRDNNPIAAAAAFANQKQYWEDFARIWNSDKMKERRGGLKEDVAAAEIANAAAGSKNKVGAVLSYLLKIGYTPTQMADSFAIASGGAPFYRNRIKSYLKEGQSQTEAEANAWNDFTKVSDETQQSGDPRDISKQQASAAGRLLLTFQNTAMQQSRIVKKAILDLKNRRGDDKTNVAKIAYYLAIQNTMFAVLQQGLFAVAFGYDDEDKEKPEKEKKLNEKLVDVADGVVDTILRGTGFVGGIVATLKNMAKKYLEEKDKKFKADYAKVMLEGANISPPIGSKLRKLYSGLQQSKFEKDLIEERGWGVMQDGRIHLGPMYGVSGKLVESFTNVPMDRLVTKIENASQAMNSQNQAWQRVMVGLGWSPYSIGIEDSTGDQAIRAKAKEIRAEEGKIKAKETRERTKDSIKALPIEERIKLKREAALKRREEKLKKRKRKMG